MGWGGPDKGEQSLASLAPNAFAAFLLCCSFWSLISIGCGFRRCFGCSVPIAREGASYLCRLCSFCFSSSFSMRSRILLLGMPAQSHRLCMGTGHVCMSPFMFPWCWPPS